MHCDDGMLKALHVGVLQMILKREPRPVLVVDLDAGEYFLLHIFLCCVLNT